jgi:hypothetical protein
MAALAAFLIPNGAAAQRVVADIRIHEGPISGRIVVGHPYGHSPRAVFAVGPRYHHDSRHGYRHVTVYRVHRGHAWYGRHGYRAVRLRYDPACDCYFERAHRDRGLREIVIYERGGRYYRDGWSNRDGRRDGGPARQRGDGLDWDSDRDRDDDYDREYARRSD